MKSAYKVLALIAATALGASSFSQNLDRYLLILANGSGKVARHDFVTGITSTFINVGSMNYLNAVAVGPDKNIYIARSDRNEIHRYDGVTGSALGVFATKTPGFPHGIAFDKAGQMFVSGNDNGNVYRYSKIGVFIDEFVSSSSNQLKEPRHMIFHPSGDLYISSVRNNSVRRFKPDGTGTQFLGGQSDFDGLDFVGDGDLLTAQTDSGNVRRWDAAGNSEGIFIEGLKRPRGLAHSDFNGSRKYFVAEESTSTVAIANSLGTVTSRIDLTGLGLGRLNYLATYTPVPEPGSAFVVVAGLVALLKRRSGRKQ